MTQAASTRASGDDRQRLPRAERREAIVHDAARAFAAAGFAGTSMADIAEAAGVTHAIVYRHFPSKDDLYRAVLVHARATLSTALLVEPGPRAFGVDVEAILASARDDEPGVRTLLRHAAREPEFAEHAQAVRDEAVDAARRSLRQLVPRHDLEWAAQAVVGHVFEAVLVWLEHGDPSRDQRFVAATEAAIRAGVRTWSRNEDT